MELLRDNLAEATSFSLVGIVLIVLGYLALDLVTPGRLRQLVWVEHNRNATVLTTAMVIGVSLVVVCSVVASENMALWRGLVYTIAYAVVAIAVMMWSFVLIDWLTPGKLGTMLLENDEHPAGWISAAIFVGVGAIVSAAVLF